MGVLLPHSFPRLTAMITGANCLDSLPGDRDSIEYSQELPKLLVLGSFPVFSYLTWTAYFHFLLVERKQGHLSVLTSFRAKNSFSLPSRLCSASSLTSTTSPLQPLLPISCFCTTMGMACITCLCTILCASCATHSAPPTLAINKEKAPQAIGIPPYEVQAGTPP